MIGPSSSGQSYRRSAHLLRLLRTVSVLTFLSALNGSTAAAQNRNGVKPDHAALHIQATIIPTAIVSDSRGNYRPDVAINFNFPQNGFQLSTLEDSRYVLIKRRPSAGDQLVLLRTTTVVPK